MNWNTFNQNSLSNQLGVYGQPIQYAPEMANQGFGLGQQLSLGDPNQFSDALSNLGGQSPTGLLASLGKFAPVAQLGLGAIGTIGGLMQSNKMLGLAKDQFKHTRDVTNTNLTNQIQSYNTALSDRSRTRAAMEGRDQASADRYVEENKLRR